MAEPTMARFQLVSDLHSETPMVPRRLREPEYAIPQSAPHLIIAGDLGRAGKLDMSGKSIVASFLEEFSERFENVFYVPGNHEFYFSEYHSALEGLKTICDGLDNVHLLHQSFVELEDVIVVGCTLWAQIPDSAAPAVSRMMQDYKAIGFLLPGDPARKLLVSDTTRMHSEDLDFLRVTLTGFRESGVTKPVVVVSHHAPLKVGTSKPVFEASQDPAREGYATDLRLFIEEFADVIDVWAFGHTHWASDQEVAVGGSEHVVRVVSNALGYIFKRENTGFRKDFSFSVGGGRT